VFYKKNIPVGLPTLEEENATFVRNVDMVNYPLCSIIALKTRIIAMEISNLANRGRIATVASVRRLWLLINMPED
jgi:hypothetical protein